MASISLTAAVGAPGAAAQGSAGVPPQGSCKPPPAKIVAFTPSDVEMESVVIASGDGFAAYIAACPGKDVVLFLDWLPLSDVKGELLGDGTLRFRLERGPSSKHNWDLLLGRPRLSPKKVAASFGFAEGQPLASTTSVRLNALPPLYFGLALILFGLLGLGFLLLASKTGIIRSEPSKTPKTLGPYSLSQTQAAWWFFVVLGTYLLIGIVTGDFTTSLNATALGLIGLGGGTAVGATLIASSRDDTGLQDSKDAAQARVSQVLAGADYSQDKKNAAEGAQKVLCNQSQGFVIDILTDADGVCFHRFQIVAWTLVLTGVFVNSVYENLAMPDFDPTLFGLLGLSSLTYLGLKPTEKRVPKTPNP